MSKFQRHTNLFHLKVPRHDGRVLWLTYKPEGNVKKTVYLVSLFYLGAFFTLTSGFRWARVSPMTLVVLTSRLEVSWQVVLMLYLVSTVMASSVNSGMSRDKCGAAAVAGLMASIAAQQPQGVKVGDHEH